MRFFCFIPFNSSILSMNILQEIPGVWFLAQIGSPLIFSKLVHSKQNLLYSLFSLMLSFLGLKSSSHGYGPIFFLHKVALSMSLRSSKFAQSRQDLNNIFPPLSYYTYNLYIVIVHHLYSRIFMIMIHIK